MNDFWKFPLVRSPPRVQLMWALLASLGLPLHRRQLLLTALQLELSKLLVSYSALAPQTRGGLLTLSPRDAVNAAQVSNPYEALGPSAPSPDECCATCCSSKLIPVACSSAQRPPQHETTKNHHHCSAARSDSNGEQRVGRVGPAAAAAASAAAAATATI